MIKRKTKTAAAAAAADKQTKQAKIDKSLRRNPHDQLRAMFISYSVAMAYICVYLYIYVCM